LLFINQETVSQNQIDMKKERIYLFLLCVTAALLFYFSNETFKGSLSRAKNEKDFAYHAIDSLDYYEITYKAPFKYRLLFSSIVKTTFHATHESTDVVGYFHTYKFWSLVFYVTSALAMFFLLRSLAFEPDYSFSGALIFLLLPPMLLAYTLPVHTREDTLAYSLFFVGLIFLIKENRIWFIVISLLGVLTRETLLLLPLLYLFYSRDENIIRRLLISGTPVLVWISIRLILGMEKYDVWEGLKWNLNNPDQVIGFLIITFNFCWIPFLIHLIYYRSSLQSTEKQPVHFFYKTSLFSLFIILATTFVGGIFNEIRLLYLFVPWIIVIFIDFVRTNIGLFKTSLTQKSFWMYAVLVLIFCSFLIYVVMLNWQRFIVPGKFKVPYELWIIVSIGYLFITLLLVPVFLRFLNLRKSYK
jgi:hypothetical protein